MTMKLKLLLFVAFAVLACPSVRAEDKPKDIVEKKLEARYKKQKVNVVPLKVIVAPYTMSIWQDTPSDDNFTVHYDHFYQGLQMPKRYQKRDEFDDRTTQEVTARTIGFDEMEAGELLEVLRVNLFKRGRDVYMLDFMLKALAAKRLATITESVRPDSPEKINFGVHFRFIFPLDVVERGDYDTIVREIDPYFLPAAEYKGALVKAQAPKNIEIQPGMSKEDIIKMMGEPLKAITFGKKTTLTYKEVTIELEDNKVVNVRPN